MCAQKSTYEQNMPSKSQIAFALEEKNAVVRFRAGLKAANV